MSLSLVILGGGGHAKVLAGIVQRLGLWKVAGYTDVKSRGELLGLPYLGGDGILQSLRESGYVDSAALGVGQMGDVTLRVALLGRLETLGFQLPTIVDPAALLGPQTRLGPATVVMPGAVINAGTIVGTACIINTNATVEHDCSIGSHTHIAPGAVVCGGCQVGESTLIGARAVLTPGVRVADACIIGAGATVVCDILEPGTYVGTPARKLR